jgi:hypothetical protein
MAALDQYEDEWGGTADHDVEIPWNAEEWQHGGAA